MGCHFLQGIFPTQVSCIAGRFFIIWATREGVFTLSSHSTLAPEVRCDETMGGLSRLSVQDQVAPASHGHLSPCYGFLRSSAMLWHRGSQARALAPLGLGRESWETHQPPGQTSLCPTFCASHRTRAPHKCSPSFPQPFCRSQQSSQGSVS